jgi:membrane protein DedA with SNARE-associated domain
VEHVVNTLGPVLDPWGYVLLFAVVALEASAFVGLVVPGETALLLAGFLASQGRMVVWIAAAVGVFGAVLGDSVGYEIGRHLGERLRNTWVGRKVGESRWDRARQVLRDHGGRAVLIGVLRAMVPAAAGDSRLPYRTFLTWNVIGAVVWAPAMVAVGYFAGSAYKTVERFLGWGTLAILAAVVVAWLAVRYVRTHHTRDAEAEGTSTADVGKTSSTHAEPRADRARP